MRAVALITGRENLLDHLGVLSHCLEIPLIVSDETTYALAKQFYPDLDVTHRELSELTLEFFARHFDIIFETGKFFAVEIAPFIELFFRKKMRFVYCPHGNSDKGHSLTAHVDQDISLVYGDHLWDLLKRTGATDQIKHIFKTGNYRYSYYLRHKEFYDALTEALVFRQFQGERPILLYAPTWDNRENPTSFFAAIDPLIHSLSHEFHLLVKLHPLLIEAHPAEMCAVLARYEGDPRVYFLNHFPPIYPLLTRCAAYVGDYSSVGYDFLAFDKPLYFLSGEEQEHASPLRKCGWEIPKDQLSTAGAFISESLEESREQFRQERQALYAYAFGQEQCLKTLKQSIFTSGNYSTTLTCR